jgi:hypothetical protein
MIGEGDCGAIGGIKIGRETKVLGVNLPQRHTVHHKSHLKLPPYMTPKSNSIIFLRKDLSLKNIT